MPLSKCPRCEKLFDKTSTAVCSKCREDEEADFDLIRSTLDDSPELNAEQVAEVSGVAIDCVLRMLDTGLISNITLNEGETFKCGRCGAPAISATKKLCQPCLEKLNQEMAESRRKVQLGDRKQVQLGEYSAGGVRQQLDEKRR